METALEVRSHLQSDHNVKSPPSSMYPPLGVFKRPLPQLNPCVIRNQTSVVLEQGWHDWCACFPLSLFFFFFSNLPHAFKTTPWRKQRDGEGL